MLRKLFKFEMKAVSGLLLPLHILVLLASILGHFTVTINAARLPKYMFPLLIIAYIVLIFVVCISTYVILAARFYKNLFTDEGYLTLTIPAKPGQHLLAKCLSGSIWVLIDVVVLVISICLLFFSPEVIESLPELLVAFRTELSMDLGHLLWMIAGLLLVSVLFAPPSLYVCIAVGQLFPSHRVLGAVISYFLLSTLVSVITILCFLPSGYLPYMFDTTSIPSNLYHGYMSYLIGMTVSLSTIVGILAYIGTYFILKQKINLD